MYRRYKNVYYVRLSKKLNKNYLNAIGAVNELPSEVYMDRMVPLMMSMLSRIWVSLMTKGGANRMMSP